MRAACYCILYICGKLKHTKNKILIMKSASIYKIFSIVFLAFLISGCGLTKMTSKYDTVLYTVTPPILQVHGGKVALQIDGNIPEKYFHKNATIELTPVLKSENSETTFKTITLQGEEASGGQTTIPYVSGGGFTYKDEITYSSELMNAEQVNLVMDNWFLREAGSKSGAPFHHDISYFDFEGSMCVLWLPLEPVPKEEAIAWIKGSHLWDKLYIRTRFQEGHPDDGAAGIVNGKSYEITPNILENKGDYEFLHWDLDIGDCVFFDIRTLHGSLSQSIPKNDIHRYTLRMAKEGSKIEYRGDWAQAERAIMESNGYQNGDDLSGKMFPTLYQRV